MLVSDLKFKLLSVLIGASGLELRAPLGKLFRAVEFQAFGFGGASSCSCSLPVFMVLLRSVQGLGMLLNQAGSRSFLEQFLVLWVDENNPHPVLNPTPQTLKPKP